MIGRPLKELVNSENSAMRMISEWIATSSTDIEVLPTPEKLGAEALLALQVTTASPLGALAYETGGIIINGGWLRLLGAESPKLGRGIASWNQMGEETHRLKGGLLIADDAMGGFFAINGGGLPGPVGNVFYLAPDTCSWEDLDMGHTDWVHWTITGNLSGFYESMHWAGYEDEVATLRGNQCIMVYPFLWAEGPAIQDRSRKPIPVEEAWGLHTIDFPKQLGTAGGDDAS
jgi:hypothetical protein